MSASRGLVDPSFLWRKLHSLSGIVPIGAFLAEHFWSNAYLLVGHARYDTVGQDLQTIPFRLAVEAGVIWLPLLYHSLYGFYIWYRGQSNVVQYPWVGNWMYTLQRWTGLIAFFFILWHVYTTRIITAGRSNSSTVQHDMASNLYVAFYIIGVLAASTHLGVGIWNFLCKWGIAATVRAQRAAGFLGVAVGLLFSLAGLAIVAGARYDWHPFGSYVQ